MLLVSGMLGAFNIQSTVSPNKVTVSASLSESHFRLVLPVLSETR